MDWSPESTPPRTRRSVLNLALPEVLRLSHGSESSEIFVESSSAELVRLHSPRDKSLQSEPPDFNTVAQHSFSSNLDVERVAVGELQEIFSLVKAKNEVLSRREQDLQRSHCAIAEAVGIAKTQLRNEVNEMLRASQVELRKEVTKQLRRLEGLHHRAQEEFRKAVTWRREVQAMKESAKVSAEKHDRLARQLQDTQRRCAMLVQREKAHQQELQEERNRWEEERRQLEKQRSKLQQEMRQMQRHHAAVITGPISNLEEALPSSDQNRSSAKLPSPPEGRRQSRRLRPKRGAYSSSESDSAPSNVTSRQREDSACMQVPCGASASNGRVKDLLVPLIGAWWGLDFLFLKNSRGLWGYVALLTEALGMWENNHTYVMENTPLEDLAICFIRRWVWQLLLEDISLYWRDAAHAQSATVREDIEHNAFAWARRARKSKSFNTVRVHCSEDGETEMTCASAPFDLHTWLPAMDSSFWILRNCLAAALGIESNVSTICHSMLSDYTPTPSKKLLTLVQARSQNRLAEALWKDARKQLLASEPLLRDGQADPASLAEVGKTLLSAAVLSLAEDSGNTQAALRALLHLCTSHTASLQIGLRDALPVLLWLADANGSMDCATGAVTESIAALLWALAPTFGTEPTRDTLFVATALVRLPLPAQPTTTTMVEALINLLDATLSIASSAADSDCDAVALRAMMPRLRFWFAEHCCTTGIRHSSGGTVVVNDFASRDIVSAAARLEAQLAALELQTPS